jgi:hypothetical protein
MPFDTAHNARICGAPDLTPNGPNAGNGTWSGTRFTGDTCGDSTPIPSNSGRNLAQNSSFGVGTQGWTATPSTNFVTYPNGQSGARFAATNTTVSGGGFYQDIAINTVPYQTFCATAEVRTAGGGTGAGGSLAIWQLGGSYNDEESVHFNSLSGSWRPVRACAVATTSHTVLRVQIYVNPNSPTLDVDDVDIH